LGGVDNRCGDGLRPLQAAMAQEAFVLRPSTPEKLGAFVNKQLESYGKVVRVAGVLRD
jgi:tripartite-type tricarboxylate transporter receptor subunit TctC